MVIHLCRRCEYECSADEEKLGDCIRCRGHGMDYCAECGTPMIRTEEGYRPDICDVCHDNLFYEDESDPFDDTPWPEDRDNKSIAD